VWEERLRNDLFCIEWGVKPNSINSESCAADLQSCHHKLHSDYHVLCVRNLSQSEMSEAPRPCPEQCPTLHRLA